MISLPISNDPDQQFSVFLGGQRVSMRVRWNDVSGRWSFDISRDGEPILTGRRIVTGRDLLAAFDFGIGLIFASGNSEPGREELPNGTVQLFSAREDDFLALDDSEASL